MANTVANIVVGAPSVVTISAQGVAQGSGVIVGCSDGGMKLNFAPEYFFKKCDQFLGKVGAIKTNEDCTAEITLVEASLANLAYAFGYPTSAVAGTKLSIGGSPTVTERTVYIDGNAPGSGTMKITLFKCVLIGAVEVNMEKDKQTAVKMTVQVLEDTSRTAGDRFFEIDYSSTDTTAPTIAMTTPAEDGTVTKATLGTVVLTITETGNLIDENTLVYGRSVMVLNTTDATAVVQKAGTITYDKTGKTITFTPTAVWVASDKHSIVVTTELRDMAGNALATTFIGNFTVTA